MTHIVRTERRMALVTASDSRLPWTIGNRVICLAAFCLRPNSVRLATGTFQFPDTSDKQQERDKKSWSPTVDTVTVLTMHASKRLEHDPALIYVHGPIHMGFPRSDGQHEIGDIAWYAPRGGSKACNVQWFLSRWSEDGRHHCNGELHDRPHAPYSLGIGMDSV